MNTLLRNGISGLNKFRFGAGRFQMSVLKGKGFSSQSPGGNSFYSKTKLHKVYFAIPVVAGAGLFLSSNGKESGGGSTPLETLDKVASSGLNKYEFSSYKLVKVEEVSHDTKLFRFALPPNTSLNLPITSCLIVRNPEGTHKKQEIRPYTPVSTTETVGHFDLIIKRYTHGALTPYIHSMKPGDTLEFKGPFPKYPYQPNTLKQVALIAGGSGITPMLQLIRKIVDNPKDNTKVTLLFANKTENDILLKQELDQLALTYPDKFQVEYILSDPSSGWKGRKGRINKSLLEKKLPGTGKEDVMVFICGPDPMVKSMAGAKKSTQEQGPLSGYLNELGYSEHNVFKF